MISKDINREKGRLDQEVAYLISPEKSPVRADNPTHMRIIRPLCGISRPDQISYEEAQLHRGPRPKKIRLQTRFWSLIIIKR